MPRLCQLCKESPKRSRWGRFPRCRSRATHCVKDHLCGDLWICDRHYKSFIRKVLRLQATGDVILQVEQFREIAKYMSYYFKDRHSGLTIAKHVICLLSELKARRRTRHHHAVLRRLRRALKK
jgi:tRNA G26 N,N-dimethylase Trm1